MSEYQWSVYQHQSQIIGSFSINADREFVDDRSQLKFFRPPKDRETRVRMDLNRGLDEVVRKDEDKCKEERISRLIWRAQSLSINHRACFNWRMLHFQSIFTHRMLKWITINKDKFVVGSETSGGQQKIKTLNTDFGNLIFWNIGLFSLNKLRFQSVSVVSLRNSCARRTRTARAGGCSPSVTGARSICTRTRPRGRSDRGCRWRQQRTAWFNKPTIYPLFFQASDRLKAMQSWGYKFEQYMMSDTMSGEPGVICLFFFVLN